MRIIAGKYKSRVIHSIQEYDTRPTSDKIRGSIFNMIGPFFDGGTALDLFSGSGALGLEALSRGMDKVYLIDKNYKAIKVINKNVESLGCIRESEVFKIDALKFLKSITETFDCIFLDPPYKLDIINEVMDIISKRDLLSKDGIIVVETHKSVDIKSKDLECISEKTYGITKIKIFKRSE